MGHRSGEWNSQPGYRCFGEQFIRFCVPNRRVRDVVNLCEPNNRVMTLVNLAESWIAMAIFSAVLGNVDYTALRKTQLGRVSVDTAAWRCTKSFALTGLWVASATPPYTVVVVVRGRRRVAKLDPPLIKVSS